MPPLATAELVDGSRPTATQRACYKYFAVAALLFVVQVSAGLLTLAYRNMRGEARPGPKSDTPQGGTP